MSTIEDLAGDAPTGDERAHRLEELWRRHRQEHDPKAREELVAAYYPLVQHMARRLSASLSDRVERGDLEGWGAEGLIDAVDRYELGRGAQFTTFAALRIKGAVFDGLRAADWAPRSVRRRARELNEVRSYLSIEHGREPTEEEEAVALGIGISALRTSKAKIFAAELSSLDQRLSSAQTSQAREPADPDPEPDLVLTTREQSRSIEEGIRMLSPRQRRVTQLSFGEGMTLAEIGRLLGVTESRVCQIRSNAIRRLREYVYAEGVGS